MMDFKSFLQCQLITESEGFLEYFSVLSITDTKLEYVREGFDIIGLVEGVDYKINGNKSWMVGSVIGFDVMALLEAADIELDDTGEYLTEGAQRAFKKYKDTIRQYYRCRGGNKDGQLVADAASCAKKKDPKRVLHSKIVNRKRMGIRLKKTAISKNKALSKLIARMNKRWGKS